MNHRYRPADWHPIDAAWLTWPQRRTTWPGRLDRAKSFYGQWIAAIAESTPVQLLVNADHDVPRSISQTANVTLVEIQTDDVWIRDYGPQWVFDGDELIVVGFKFNSWGQKYPPWHHDDAAAEQIAAHVGVRYEAAPIVLEGGAIEFNGHRAAIINQPAVIDAARGTDPPPNGTEPDTNAGLHRSGPAAAMDRVQTILRQRLGIEQTVWVNVDGPAGDDTDGHIDQIARFAAPQTVVLASGHADCPGDVASMNRLRQQLRDAADQNAMQLDLVDLPSIPPRQIDGQTLPQSYCNYQRLGPDRLLVPTFGVAQDERAIAILREVSGADCQAVDCREMIYGLGAIHCASNEQPSR